MNICYVYSKAKIVLPGRKLYELIILSHKLHLHN